MFNIENDIIYLTRGNKAIINLTIDDYIFKVGDKIAFRIYNKNSLNKLPLLDKKVTVESETDNIDIELTSEDTKIGEMQNNIIDYWYEIELNNEQTIIGYDDDGPKILTMYPEGTEGVEK